MIEIYSEEKLGEEKWLQQLAQFIVEANKNTWAADGAEVPEDAIQRPGYKELKYKNGLWLLRDSYTGYYRAPGATTYIIKEFLHG